MGSNPFHRAIYLTGPTASGKTAVGVALARVLDAEVNALDSMTLYRGMDIGTAKPSIPERGGIPHHLIDVLDPWESASVAEYRAMALAAVADVTARGRRALFVGGTALYLKALLRGLFQGPGADPDLRRGLQEEAGRRGSAALHARLAALDPPAARRLHPNDLRRIIRALEVIALSGRPLSALQTEHERPAPPEVPVFALRRPRDELHERIDRRVVQMFDAGLIDEVRALLAGPRPLGPVPAQGVGYREVIDLLAGRATLADTVDRVRARTRQFAKRQETWFRGLAEVVAWPVGPDEPAEETAARLASRIQTRDTRHETRDKRGETGDVSRVP
jgi:tRNA dimethylallyltransferase